MKLLAFDTCFLGCSVAVLRDSMLIAHRMEVLGRGHAEVLVPLIEEVLSEADMRWGALDGIGVTHGPGSFTGLRVGLAAARAISLARGLPVAAFSSLHVMAVGAVRLGGGADRTIAAASDARRGEVYLQVFGPGAALTGPPELIPLSIAAARVPLGAVGIGSGVAPLREAMGEWAGGLEPLSFAGYPDAQDLGLLAVEAMSDPAWTDPGPPTPIYLRPPHVVMPKPRELK